MNIWAYCEDCDLWFRCRMDRAADWACRSCGMEPIRIENRTVGQANEARRRDDLHMSG